jgi:hypothetical protein
VVAPLIASAIPAVIAIIDKLIPDADQAAQAKLKLLELEQSGELQLALGQQAINQVEAASTDYRVAGWRPAVGWICVFALGYNFIVQPLLAWVSVMLEFPAPPLASEDLLLTLLGILLGIGGLRTVEKIKGVAR